METAQRGSTPGKPLRIAFIGQPIGGLSVDPLRSDSLGLWSYHVATRFAEHDEVLLYAPRRPGDGPDEELHRGMRIVRIPVRRDERFVRLHGRLRERWKRMGGPVDRRRPPFASPVAYLEYIGRIALDLRRRGCDVAHFHNFSQFAPVLRALNPDLRIVINMQCEWLATLDRRAIAHRLRSVDLILGCTEFIADGPRKRFPELASRCRVLPNGFDPDLFPMTRKPPDSTPSAEHRGPRLLYVGRLSPEKGIHVLLDAFEQILRAHPDARLALVGGHGPAPTEYLIDLSDDPRVRDLTRFYSGELGYVEQLRRKLPSRVAERIDFIEDLPQRELLARYRSSDLFVFPSACNEAFGMPPVEAMACGVPVVAARIGGLPEVVTEDGTGVLFEPHDAADLARAVNGLLDDPERLRRLGDAGPDACARYTWERVAARLRALLREEGLVAER
jgi:glycosyltransferase involved in cell wall biosynthesis